MNNNGYKIIDIDRSFLKEMRSFIKIKITKKEISRINSSDNYFKKNYGTNLDRSFNNKIEFLANKEAFRIAKKYFNLIGTIPFVDRKLISKAGYPKLAFFFRIIRKNKSSDVGYPHTDYSYWQIAKTEKETPPFSKCKKRVKVWIPLLGCDKKNSLSVFEKSHKAKKNFKIICESGVRPRPIALSLEKYNKVTPLWLKEKQSKGLLFDDKLVHAGQVNLTTDVRISAEFHIIME